MLFIQIIKMLTAAVCFFAMLILLSACGGGSGNGSNDSFPVSIASVYPENYSKGVALNQAIEVSLTEKALSNTSQIEAKFSLSGTEGAIPGSVIIKADRARFRLNKKLQHFTTYHAQVSLTLYKTDGSIITESYDWSFKTAWTRVATADTALCCDARDQAFDTAGNIYVTGYTRGNFDGNTNANPDDPNTHDGFLIKYSTSSQKLWSSQFGTAGDDIASSVTLDPSNNIYVTGHIGNGGGDIFTRKVDNDGNLLWTKYLGVSNHFSKTVEIDHSGNIIVIAQDYGAKLRILIAKYTADGELLWQSYYENQYAFTSSNSIAIDSKNNIYAIGDVQQYLKRTTIYGWYDFLAVVKYDENGTMQWEQLIEPEPGPDFDNQYVKGYNIAIDSDDNVYCVGITKGFIAEQPDRGIQDNDGYLVKVSANGVKLWAVQFGTSKDDDASFIFVDHNGDINIFGAIGGQLTPDFPIGGSGMFAKYDADGKMLFMKPAPKPSAVTKIWSIASDGLGHIYKLGNGFGLVDSVPDSSTVLLRYDMDGNNE